MAKLHLEGRSQEEIAAQIGVSQPTVSRDIDAVLQEWRESAKSDIADRTAEELAGLKLLRSQVWAAWHRSVGEHIKTVDGKDGVTTTTEELAGDPRYLDVWLRAGERLSRLLGMDAPKKTDITSGGKPITKLIAGVDPAELV